MRVEIITNPSVELFIEMVKESNEQLMASPFIKANVAKMIIDSKPSEARVSLLTSYKLTNFYRNSSDINALRYFIDNQQQVRNYPKLHAKAYIFDAQRAIITSANLTISGLETNYECGIFIDDSSIATKLKKNFLNVFSDEEKAPRVSNEILTITEGILAKVPQEKKIKFEKSERDLFPEAMFEKEDDLYDGGVQTIVNTLSGWRLDVFNLVLGIQSDIFKLEQVYKHKHDLQKLHPENRRIEAKIRQQLQGLRDLGLIEFLGGGVYRKLWKDV